VQDRIVQGALRHALEPLFEKDFAPHSYGFRPGKGCKDALRRVQELLDGGYKHVVDADQPCRNYRQHNPAREADNAHC
jgi:RNA-directed DNA polymerase